MSDPVLPPVRLTRRGRRVLLGAALTPVLLLGYACLRSPEPPLDGVAAAANAPRATPDRTSTPGPTTTAAAPPPRSPRARSASPSPTVTTSRSADRPGALVVVPGSSRVSGHGPLHRYRVEVQTGLGVDPASFAAAVDRVLADPRGWTADGLSLQRTDGPAEFRVVLSSPALTDELCRPLSTGGTLSCFNSRGTVALNADRWRYGASTYAGDLPRYREYLVTHEVGHALGHGHAYSCLPSGLAPVMMQQTKSLMGCARNPWPHPGS